MKTKFIFLFLFLLYFSGIRAQEKKYSRTEFMEKWGKELRKSVVSAKSGSIGDSPVLETERNLPRKGDSPIMLKGPYLPAGDSGKDITWDFNRLQINGDEREEDYLVTPRSSLTGIRDMSMCHYRIAGDSLLLDGYEDPKHLVRLEKPEEIMLFPMRYGDERTGRFYGKGKYCDRLEMDIAGLNYSKADGYGILVLPGNDTLRNILRVYTSKITSTHTRPLDLDFDLNVPVGNPLSYDDILLRLGQDTSYCVTESYRWYAEGSRYPVLETEIVQRVSGEEVSSLSADTYVFHPFDQEELPEDTANQAVRDKKSAARNTEYPAGNESITITNSFTARIYPNPVVNDLQVNLQLSRPEPVELSLYNLQGQMLHRRNIPAQSETIVETVNMSRFSRGSYILKLQAGGKSERKVIIKQ